MTTQHFDTDPLGHLPADTDIAAVLRDGTEDALHAVWNTYHYARHQRDVLDRITTGELDPDDYEGDVETYTRTELALIAEVTPLQALRANRRLVRLLTEQRWPVMQYAREVGASWAAIGDALEVTKQGAIDWYKRKISGSDRSSSKFHDTYRARAVVDDWTGPPQQQRQLIITLSDTPE